jgi:predicted MFS family arabinose efflux permease
MSTKFAIDQPVKQTAQAPLPRLPLSGLMALTVTGFTAIFSETLPAGLLREISHGLGMPESGVRVPV